MTQHYDALSLGHYPPWVNKIFLEVYEQKIIAFYFLHASGAFVCAG